MSTVKIEYVAVLFDCDGVLVDSEPITNTVLCSMLNALGWQISLQDCIQHFIGKSLKDESEVIHDQTGFYLTEDWLDVFRSRRDDALRTTLKPIDGAANTLARVTAAYGNRIACVTGADRTKVEMQLAVTGLDQWFGDRVFSGMEQPQSKPAPDVYLAAAESLRINPANSLVIEDTVTGVTAGVAAGATVFGYAAGGSTSASEEDLRNAGATQIFNHMADLPSLIGL